MDLYLIYITYLICNLNVTYNYNYLGMLNLSVGFMHY